MLKKTIISLALAGSFMLLPSCYSAKTTTRNSPQLSGRAPLKEQSSLQSSSRTKAPEKSATIETGKKPAWVSGNSRVFASHTYLTAIGYAKTRKQAENNARMEMSQIFNTKISGVRTSMNKAHAVRKNGKVQLSESEYTAETAVKNETASIFAGLELSRYWKNDKGTIYVLATINKTKVLPPLKEKMRKMDNIIEKLVNEANNSHDKLLRITKLNKALKKAVLREYYNAQVAIMSSRGQTVKSQYDLETIVHMLDTQLENISIAVSVSGEGNKNIRYAIVKALSNLNLKINSDDNTSIVKLDEFEDFTEDASATKPNLNSNVDIVIIGEVSFKALDRGDEYKWVTGVVNLSIKNNKANKIYNTITVSKRIRRLTLQDARRMTGIKLVKELTKELEAKLVDTIGSQKK